MAIGRAVQRYRDKRAAAEAARLALREAGMKAPDVFDPAEAKQMRDDLAALATEDSLEINDTRALRVRHKKTGRIRRAKFLMAVDVMRIEGLGPKDIADALGVSYQAVTAALVRLRDNADFVSQVKRLDDIAVPLAVDNVIVGVKNGSQFYTHNLMKGRGLYRSHKSIESAEKKETVELTIRVEYPDHFVPGSPLPQMRPGSVAGVPRLEDIDVPKALPAPAAAKVGVGTPDLR